MLCIFLGPTKSPDPLQAVAPPQWPRLERAVAGVALVERGPKYQRDIAGECQAVLERDVGPCEHDALTGYFPDGKHQRRVLQWETPPQRYERRLRELGQAHLITMIPFSESSDPFVAEPLLATALSPLIITPYAADTVWISPRVDEALGRKLDFADLPEGWNWGNGVTCNSWLKLRTGEVILLSWCVLAPETALAVRASPARWQRLCDLMEA